MKKTIQIKASIHWDKRQTDCRECMGCDEVIFSNMYIMCFQLGAGKLNETKFALCESCKDCVNI